MSIGEERKAVGIMYAGGYAEPLASGEPAENVYIAYNFHYDEVQLALPAISGSRHWHFVMNTSMEESFSFEPQPIENQHSIVVPGRSISIYVSK
jgi:glycogen operon protein